MSLNPLHNGAIFTLEEIDTLLKACDALGSSHALEFMSKSLIGIMSAPSQEKAEKFRDKALAEYEKKEEQQKLFEEQLICLKAKLITMKRDSLNKSAALATM